VPLVRGTNRALPEYVLRACNDMLALTGDGLSSLLLLNWCWPRESRSDV
jgi:hypothetical protein